METGAGDHNSAGPPRFASADATTTHSAKLIGPSPLPETRRSLRLNEQKVPGPRGGQWHASTVGGDPKKAIGILNNPLYIGRLVWGRRRWRRNPDSEKRERRYRLRDRSEWVEVGVPDLRIVDDAVFDEVQSEIERRKRPAPATSPAGSKRAKQLLSGSIRCSCCGSNYATSGKDYSARRLAPMPLAEILPHPVLFERFSSKVPTLRASLDQDAVRSEAATVLASLIESVTIYLEGERDPEAEVLARVADLLAFATNDNAAREGGVVEFHEGGCGDRI